MGRPKQALISRRKTLEVALRIIDEEGLDALSIRRLGDELNVRGISLYHHFKSKEHILVGVCELALANVRTPNTSNVDWREWFVNNAIEYYTALRTHPNLIPILMRRHPLRIGLAEQCHGRPACRAGRPAGRDMALLEGSESCRWVAPLMIRIRRGCGGGRLAGATLHLSRHAHAREISRSARSGDAGHRRCDQPVSNPCRPRAAPGRDRRSSSLA